MISLNTQPVEKRAARTDGAVEVVSVFLTIQGEGPFVGQPAVFVRTAGCNLDCPACDTDYTTGRRLVPAPDLLAKVKKANKHDSASLVVITGGEPFRQALGPFVGLLLEEGYEVQVETNGTLYDPSMAGLHADACIVCSPKTPKISAELISVIDAYKYVLRAGSVLAEDGLPLSSLGAPAPPARPHPGFAGEVFVQPEDDKDPETNAANLAAAVESCLRFGYRLSVQTHKIAGLE